MTRDEIMKLEAGRELDESIARIMYPEAILFFEFPLYSTDIAAAWEVVEKLKITLIPTESPDGWACNVGQSFDLSYVWYERRVADWVYAETAPLAICRAALLALQ